jgi:pimeloyl-ACP methyl ester carboxylesterase
VESVRSFAFDTLGLDGVTPVGHDWGGLIGLRLAAENHDGVARVVATNTGPPTGDQPMPEVWWLCCIEAIRHVNAADLPALTSSRATMDAQTPLAAPERATCAGIPGQP